MLHEADVANYFWAEAENTICYLHNRFYIRHFLIQITYELFKGRRPSNAYFHQFGCTCYILIKKFDDKAHKCIFLVLTGVLGKQEGLVLVITSRIKPEILGHVEHWILRKRVNVHQIHRLLDK